MVAKPGSAQLRAANLTVERSGSVILADVSVAISAGDRIGLVGPNGAGKSTLLRALAGELSPTAGTVTTVPADATVGLLHQELDVADGESVRDYLARRVGVAAASARLDAATERLESGEPDAIEEHGAALDRWMRLGGADLDGRIDSALGAVGLGALGPAESLGVASVLSGGEQGRLGLAALRLVRADVLLLDEPTNNLDQAGLAQLEELVLTATVPMMLVSHDRRFLDRVVTSVVELDAHDRSATVYHEDWSGYLHAREVARRHAEQRYDDYRTEAARLEQRARDQRRWAEKGVKREATPPDNDRAARGFRIEKAEKLAAKSRQLERARARLEEVDKPWEPWELRFTIGMTERSGDLVAELRDAEVGLGSFHLGPLSITVGAGDRVAVTGGNGAGKTTLVKALLGEIPLDAGEQRLGRSVVVGRLDQERLRLVGDDDGGGGGAAAGDERPFLDRFRDETGLLADQARSLLAKFGIESSHLSRPATSWSPGERTRVVLATFQATGVNTLVLDEPTNHLDLPAIEQLEGALDRFAGTLLVITHDRAFLESIRLTRTIALAAGHLTTDTPV